MAWYEVGINIVRCIMLLSAVLVLQFIFVPTRRVKEMPVAVIVNSQSDKIPLTTAPPDGYVIVRRMNYGEKLLRDGMAAKFLMSGSAKDSNVQGELDMQTEEVALWEFANLVVEHNLQDADERLLNFKNRSDVKKLDPAIGDEIGRLIDAQNAAQDSEEVKNY